jgi:ubiquinone/menaquinone biosynthesis C-methylase UbiE
MKSTTDLHWNERAASVAADIEVNIMDVFQRELEYDYVGRYLTKDMQLLEVGCGNGFSTQRFRDLVSHVDAMDYAENMIDRARERIGEQNNRFIHDNILEPKELQGPYDAVVCVRVLINLADFEQQLTAIDVMTSLLKANGTLILAEGFNEGFRALSRLRADVGLEPLSPARINYYSDLSDLMPHLEASYDVTDTFHLGAYDYLTRVMYPLVAAPEEPTHNTVMSERCVKLARAFNPDSFEEFSRMRGLVLRKRT